MAPSWIRWTALAIAVVKAAMQAREQAQILLLRQVGGGLHAADADRIDAVRLLDEDVLAGADGGLGVHRMELRGAGDQHHVDAVDHLLVAVEAAEEMILIGDDLAGHVLLEPVVLGLQAVGENVAHGGQFHVGAGLQRLARPRRRSARRSRSCRS